MALFSWKCTSCGRTDSDFFDSLPELGPCPDCGGFQDFSTQLTNRSIETIDMGYQIKKVEQISGIEELIAERANKDYRS